MKRCDDLTIKAIQVWPDLNVTFPKIICSIADHLLPALTLKSETEL